VCVPADLLGYHVELSLVFKIVVLNDQFFVLYTLSVVYRISVVPEKRGVGNGKSKRVRRCIRKLR